MKLLNWTVEPAAHLISSLSPLSSNLCVVFKLKSGEFQE